MECATCETRNETGAAYCRGCGEPLQRSATSGVSRYARWIAAAVGVIVLAVAGGFIAHALGGGSDAVQGAKSPEAAAAQFVGALEKKDPAGLVQAMDPGETHGLESLLSASRKKLASTGKTRNGHELDGVTLQLKDLTTSTTQLSSRVARVTYTGGYGSIQVDRSKLSPMLAALIPQSWQGGDATVKQVQDNTSMRMALMTTNNGNGWWVSPLYTIADQVAQERGDTTAYTSQLASAVTTATPEDAAKQFLTALSTGGVDAALSRIVPDEQTFLQDYSQLWRPGYQDAQSDGSVPTGTLQVQSTSTTKLSDDQVGVVIESANGTWTTGLDHGTFSLSGPSLHVTGSNQYDGWTDDVQLGNITALGQVWRVRNSPTPPDLRLIIDTVKVKDGYAVSLIGSAAATEKTAVDGFSGKDWLRILGLVETGSRY